MKWALQPATVAERNDVTVIQVEAVSEDAVDEIVSMIPEQGPVVLDLRELRWGLEAETITLADRFVGTGRLGEWRGRKAGSRTYDATEQVVTKSMPIVLVGPHTEGVGEILAAALQGAGAVLVGQKTVGHAPYMSLVRDGDVAVWMPVGQWIRSDDEPINGNGIEPNEIVEETGEGDNDPVLERALEVLNRELEKAA
jgi:C-terminal processing protease CtpA/Prc